MPGDTTKKKANTPATREKTQVQLFGETSASAKPNSASHPLLEKKKVHIEKRASKLCIRKPAAKSCVEHFHWEACLAQPDCQSTSNVNVPLTATVRLSVAGWGP